MTVDVIHDLRCERCGGETTATETNDLTTSDGTTEYRIECANDESQYSYDGWVKVRNGKIVEFLGDIFMDPRDGDTHCGCREEMNVTYREYYSVPNNTPEEFPDEPVQQMEFTRDEILGGFSQTITYDCSCGRSYDSKEALGKHLVAVAYNRGENAVT